MPRIELCESAKKGHICPDDLCRGNPDDTLCGFDQSFYEELLRDSAEPEYPDYWIESPEYQDDAK